MKKLSVLMISFFFCSVGFAKEYWCVQKGDIVKVPVSPLLKLNQGAKVSPYTGNHKGLLYKIQDRLQNVELWVFATDFEEELIPQDVESDGSGTRLIFKAAEGGVAHDLTILVVKDEVPIAISTPVGIDVRGSYADCNNR